MKIWNILALCIVLLIGLPAANAAIFINEFLPNSANTDHEWIELYNNATTSANITGFNISEESASANFTLPNLSIPAQGFVLLVNNATVFNQTFNVTTAAIVEYGSTVASLNLNDAGDSIFLYNSSGNLTDSVLNYGGPGENVSVGLFPDGSSNLVNLSVQTPGAENDNAAPVFNQWIFPAANNTNISRSVNITVNITDVTNVVNSAILTFNGTNYSMINNSDIWSVVIDTSSIGFGQTNLTVTFNDSVGLSNTDNLFNITIDNTAPSIFFVTPLNNTNVSGTLNVTMTAVDNGSVQAMTIQNGTATNISLSLLQGTTANGNWSVSYDTNTIADGVYNVTLNQTVDELGNNVSGLFLTLTIDNTIPTGSFVSPSASQNVTGTLNVTITANDATTGVQSVTVTNGTGGAPLAMSLLEGTTNAGNWTLQLDTSIMADGATNLTLNITDFAGNSNLTIFQTVNLDNTNPEITVVRQLTNTNASGSVNFTITVVDNVSGVQSVFVQNGTGGNFLAMSLLEGTTASGNWTIQIDSTLFADSTQTFAFNATDFAGNKNVSSVNTVVTLDNTAPNVSALTSPVLGQNVSAAALVFNATVNDSTLTVSTVFFNLSNGSGTVNFTQASNQGIFWNATLATSTVADGEYNVTVYANDTVGNLNSTIFTTFTIDTTVPQVFFVSPGANANVSGTINVTVTVTDATSGVQSVLVQNGTNGQFITMSLLEGTANAGNWTVQLDSTLLANGATNLTINATDFANNKNNSEFQTLTVDNLAPSGFFVVPLNGTLVTGTTNITVTAIDNASGVQSVSLINNSVAVPLALLEGTTANGNWTLQFDTTTLADGINNFTINITDFAGNVNGSVQATVTIDNNAPALVAFNSPAQGQNISQVVQINATVNDTVSTVNATIFRIVNGSGIVANITAEKNGLFFNASLNTATLADGSYNISAVMNDSLGNTNTSSNVTIVVDNTAPTLVVVNPLNQSFVNLSLNVLKFNVTDLGSGVNTSSISSTTFTFSFGSVSGIGATGITFTSIDNGFIANGSTFDLGANQVQVNVSASARDNAGNVQTLSWFYTIDSTKPKVVGFSINDSDRKVKNDTSLNITVNASNGAAGIASVNVSNVSTLSMTNITADLWQVVANVSQLGCSSDGNCTLRITAIDGAGNVNASETLVITVDNTPAQVPTIAENDADNKLRSTDSIQINVSATDANFDSGSTVTASNGSTVSLSLSATSGTTSNFTVDTTPSALGCSANGVCTVRIAATDIVGNINNSETFTITVDSAAPNVSAVFTNDSNNVVRNETVLNITVNVTDVNGVANVSVNGTQLTQLNGNQWSIVNHTGGFCNDNTNVVCVLQITATDNVSNVNNSQFLFLSIDHINPSINAVNTSDSNNLVGASDVINFTANVTDAFNVSNVSINGTTMTQIGTSDVFFINASTTQLGCSVQGNCSFNILVVDNAGNSANETLNVTVDDTPPAFGTFDAGSLPAVNNESITLSTVWTDASGIATVVFEHNATGTLINQTATAAGNNNFTLVLNSSVLENQEVVGWKSFGTDNAGRINTSMDIQTFKVENRAPVAVTIPTINFSKNSQTTVNLSAFITDPDGDNMTFTFVDPQNVTISINNETGIATLSADAEFFGLRNTTFNASDGRNVTSSNLVLINVTFANTNAPVVATIPDFNITEDGHNATLNLSNFVSDIDTADEDINWTVLLANANLSISINQVTKIINVSAVANFNGTATFVLQANDGTFTANSNAIDVNVAGVNDVPTTPVLVAPANASNASVNVTLQWNASTDVEGQTVTYFVFLQNDSTPEFNQSTTATSVSLTNLIEGQTIFWRVVAGDGEANSSNSSLFQFTVVGNNAPQILAFFPTDLAPTLATSGSQVFNVTVNDSDGDATVVSWFQNGTRLATNVSNITVQGSTEGVFNITAIVNDTSGLTASNTWTLTVNDNISSSSGELNSSVLNLSEQERQNATNVAINSSIAGSIDFGSDILNFSGVSTLEDAFNISNGSVSVNTDAFPGLNRSARIIMTGLTFTKTPIINVSSGFESTANSVVCPASRCFAINYSASTGVLKFNVSHFSTFFVSTNTTNGAPIITSTAVTTANTGATYRYDVDANDPDGDTLTFSLTTFPSGMSISSSTGEITWVPDSNQTGSFPVVAQVSDGTLTDTQSFTIVSSQGPKLFIDDVDVRVGGSSANNVNNNTVIRREAEPGDRVSFKIRVANGFTDEEDLEIEDIEVDIEIQDIDDGDDLDEESNDFDLDPEDDKRVTINFDVPLDVDEDTYDVIITVEGEDENGTSHEQFFELELEVEKDDHDIRLTNAEVFPTRVSCQEFVTVSGAMINIGSEDEDEAVLEFKSNLLELDVDKRADLEEGTSDNKFQSSVRVDIPKNLEPGVYPIEVTTYYDINRQTDSKTVEIEKVRCDQPDEPEPRPRPTVPVVTPPVVQQPIVQQPVVTQPVEETLLDRIFGVFGFKKATTQQQPQTVGFQQIARPVVFEVTTQTSGNVEVQQAPAGAAVVQQQTGQGLVFEVTSEVAAGNANSGSAQVIVVQ